ncbi:phage virion morphogenesis protein [Nitrospirillum viridazoti]|uniref:Virion morphogenesis family protein n=1 Tax=Nitrospirillum amazonense TaxID=28077 RepID=A0A560II12_9PROT|nr:phage virion morphogenesis protein [Nitrospirillum amazonense]TWB58683.1 virion morphogenesis family protein [Nitrospirillum amazonense]
MVAMRVTVQDQELRDVLAGLSGRARNLRQPMDAIGAMIQASTDIRWEREIDPDGQPWTPLASSTVKRKAKLGKERMLQISTRLRSSITRKPYADRVDVGTNVAYAAAMQNGATIKRSPTLVRIYRKVSTKGGVTDFVRHAVTTRSGDSVLLPLFTKRSKANFMTRHLVQAYSIRIPARRFLGITPEDTQGGTDILRRHVLGDVQ